MNSSGLVMFVCAGLLLSGGAILGGSTGWSLLRMSYYFWTTDLGVEFGASVMLVAGALLCLPGCWLATLVPYHPRSIALQATLMCLVTAAILVLATGLSALGGLSRALREPDTLNSSMLRAMERVAADQTVRNAFNCMQIELKCCGVSRYTDWLKDYNTLPPSCCDRMYNRPTSSVGSVVAKREQCDIPTHFRGCLRPALVELRYFVNSVSGLAAAIVVIMAVTLFATTYTLACGVMERAERAKAPPLRVACIHQLPTPIAPVAPSLAALNAYAPMPMPAAQPQHM